jgi:hypothetical protein
MKITKPSMKTHYIILITLLSTLLSIAAFAASPYNITVDIPPADIPRLEEAFGSILGLRDASGQPRPATQAEINTATAQWLGQSIHDYERRKDMAQFTPPPFSPGSKLNAPATAAPTPLPTATPKKK